MNYFFAFTIALRAEWFLEDRRKAMDLVLQISKEWQTKFFSIYYTIDLQDNSSTSINLSNLYKVSTTKIQVLSNSELLILYWLTTYHLIDTLFKNSNTFPTPLPLPSSTPSIATTRRYEKWRRGRWRRKDSNSYWQQRIYMPRAHNFMVN